MYLFTYLLIYSRQICMVLPCSWSCLLQCPPHPWRWCWDCGWWRAVWTCRCVVRCDPQADRWHRACVRARSASAAWTRAASSYADVHDVRHRGQDRMISLPRTAVQSLVLSASVRTASLNDHTRRNLARLLRCLSSTITSTSCGENHSHSGLYIFYIWACILAPRTNKLQPSAASSLQERDRESWGVDKARWLTVRLSDRGRLWLD